MKDSAPSWAKIILVLLSFAALLSFSCVIRRSSVGTIYEKHRELRPESPVPPRVNINTASADELEKLPGVGKVMAARIVEHRRKYGPFRQPEHLVLVRGMSDKRFRALRELIAVE